MTILVTCAYFFKFFSGYPKLQDTQKKSGANYLLLGNLIAFVNFFYITQTVAGIKRDVLYLLNEYSNTYLKKICTLTREVPHIIVNY